MPPRTTLLRTPPLPCLVAPSVFDDFCWAQSTVLEWRTPSDRFEDNPLDPDLPLRMAFVLRAPWGAVPTEIARFHTGRGYDLGDEPCLAPYGIDDATDQLHAQRRNAHETFWLAADNLNALFWGLHDWFHFHNHGPFEERTATELQCDAAALVWLWINRAAIPLTDARWEALRREVLVNHRARMVREPPGVPLDEAVLGSADWLREIARSIVPH